MSDGTGSRTIIDLATAREVQRAKIEAAKGVDIEELAAEAAYEIGAIIGHVGLIDPDDDKAMRAACKRYMTGDKGEGDEAGMVRRILAEVEVERLIAKDMPRLAQLVAALLANEDQDESTMQNSIMDGFIQGVVQ